MTLRAIATVWRMRIQENQRTTRKNEPRKTRTEIAASHDELDYDRSTTAPLPSPAPQFDPTAPSAVDSQR